jgi:hypothetical protein
MVRALMTFSLDKLLVNDDHFSTCYSGFTCDNKLSVETYIYRLLRRVKEINVYIFYSLSYVVLVRL